MITTVAAIKVAMDRGIVVSGGTPDFFFTVHTDAGKDGWEVYRVSVTPRISMDVEDETVVGGSMAATCRYRTDVVAFLRRFGVGSSKRIWEV
jgi:hypothetical protein